MNCIAVHIDASTLLARALFLCLPGASGNDYRSHMRVSQKMEPCRRTVQYIFDCVSVYKIKNIQYKDR